MPNNKSKSKALNVYKNTIVPFIYNVRSTTPAKFSNLGIYDVNNFQLKTKVVIEI